MLGNSCHQCDSVPQLDRVLSRIEAGAASQIVLEADTSIHCVTPSGLQPVSAQVLTRAQALALVHEMAGPDDKPAVAAGTGIRFLYRWNDKQWLVQQEADAPLRIRIRQWVDKPGPSDPNVPEGTRHLRRRASDKPLSLIHI